MTLREKTIKYYKENYTTVALNKLLVKKEREYIKLSAKHSNGSYTSRGKITMRYAKLEQGIDLVLDDISIVKEALKAKKESYIERIDKGTVVVNDLPF